MKTTVSKSDFRDAFCRMGRGEQFSYDGLGALYDYLVEYEDGSGSELELDVIALCCDFNEYADIAEYNEAYGEEFTSIDQVSEKTSTIDIDGTSFIIVAY